MADLGKMNQSIRASDLSLSKKKHAHHIFLEVVWLGRLRLRTPQHSARMDSLMAMGFGDQALVMAALAQHGDDIAAAVAQLLR